MERRKFIANTSAMVAGIPFFKNMPSDSSSDKDDIKEYLKGILYTREEVDGWFAGKLFPFSKFHSEFGWLLNSTSFQDGLNNSWSVYTYRGDDGERLMSNHADKKCRINTYGNSYTQCHQVSDNETWQEVLAAHLQEPVKNFGIGGWSVYQAYLRMLHEEKKTPSNLIIFNIYHDDHYRNLDSWRNIRAKKRPQHIEATLPFLKVDIKNDKIIENANPCPTHESYYKLCDLDQAYELFKDDFVLKIMIAHKKSTSPNPNQQFKSIMELSKTHGIETMVETGSTLSQTAQTIYTEAAIFSSTKLVMNIEEFARLNGKKVLYILSYPAAYIAAAHESGVRWDQKFIDFVKEKKLPFVDLAKNHLDDFSNYKMDIKTYLSRYFVGHYNPMGNFFCADAIRDKVIELLDPKPVPYIN